MERALQTYRNFIKYFENKFKEHIKQNNQIKTNPCRQKSGYRNLHPPEIQDWLQNYIKTTSYTEINHSTGLNKQGPGCGPWPEKRKKIEQTL